MFSMLVRRLIKLINGCYICQDIYQLKIDTFVSVATGFLIEQAAVSTMQALGAHGGREAPGLESAEPEGHVTCAQHEANVLLREGL